MSDQCVHLTTGRVKWFNKSQGYGFITAMDGDHNGDDIFVHHSKLTVTTDQFRYLVEGEYISFKWSPSDNNNNHEWQASDVTGVCGGKLMCETHNDARIEMSKMDDGEVKDRGRHRTSHRRAGARRSEGTGYKISRGRTADETVEQEQ